MKESTTNIYCSDDTHMEFLFYVETAVGRIDMYIFHKRMTFIEEAQ